MNNLTFEHFFSLPLMGEHIIIITTFVLILCVSWAILTKHIDDGILGKAYLTIFVFGLVCVLLKSVYHVENYRGSESLMMTGLMLYWVRHVWNAYIFSKIKRWYYHKFPSRCRRRKQEVGDENGTSVA